MPKEHKGIIIPLPAVVFVTAEPQSCADIANELAAQGYEINYAKDGTRAFNLHSLKPNNWKPSMFIIDLVIPGDSGFVVTKMVHDKYGDNKLPCILMTQRIAPEDKLEATQSGALGLLQKPLTIKEVNALLEREKNRRIKAEMQAL